MTCTIEQENIEIKKRNAELEEELREMTDKILAEMKNPQKPK